MSCELNEIHVADGMNSTQRKRNKITSREYCAANSPACFQAYSHFKWTHFVKFGHMKRLVFVLISK